MSAAALLRAAKRRRGCYEWRDKRGQLVRLVYNAQEKAGYRWKFSWYEVDALGMMRRGVYLDFSSRHRQIAKQQARQIIKELSE